MSSRPRLRPWPALLALGLGACLAPPPRALHEGEVGRVRADSTAEARAVSAHLTRLWPALLSLLPGARLGQLEVWVQEEPRLYQFPREAACEAEGLYAPGHDRILLSRHADDVERVLAHELTHAALGEPWTRLPGTLEEGLCDAVAARLVPSGAARLRAGRLSSAALACGGLELELEVRQREPVDGARLGWSARITLTSEDSAPDAQFDVFRVAAGLSSTRVEPGVKRGYYGLSFLAVERVLERVGFEGLWDMCHEAQRAGHGRVPRRWLLEAGGLDDEPETWRAAAAAAMGPAELEELVRMYPAFVADAIARYLQGAADAVSDPLDSVVAELRLLDGGASLEVTALPFLREAVRRSLAR